MYNDESTEYQACKLFALTNGALTWSMLVIPYEKQNKIKYWEGNKMHEEHSDNESDDCRVAKSPYKQSNSVLCLNEVYQMISNCKLIKG